MLSRLGSLCTRAQAVAFALTTAAAGAIGFLPLFGGPGYESALALGLLLPLPVALACAARACPPQDGALPLAAHRPLGALASNLGFAAAVIAAQVVVLSLHGARAGFCDPLGGMLAFGLGPASGVLLAAGWGTVAGLVAGHFRGRRRWALAAAAGAPIGGVLVSVWRFWSSPMVFAFDPFVGFFAGTLYDTVIDAVPRLVTYRAGSLGS